MGVVLDENLGRGRVSARRARLKIELCSTFVVEWGFRGLQFGTHADCRTRYNMVELNKLGKSSIARGLTEEVLLRHT